MTARPDGEARSTKTRPPGARISVAATLPWFAIALAAMFALAPLFGLARFALGDAASVWPVLAAHVLPAALRDTAILLAGISAITIVFGAGTAWIVTAFRFPGRGLLSFLLPLPLAFPTYIVAYVYVDLLDGLGPVQSALAPLFGWKSAADHWFPDVRSTGGAVFVMGFVLYPYVYLATRAMFLAQSATLIEMARVLGAGPWRLARDIAFPMARPAIAAGLSLALLEALNDIGASEYLGVQTLTLSIFSTWLNRGSLPAAARIALVMLIVIAGIIALERLGRRGRRFAGQEPPGSKLAGIRLAGPAGWFAAIACLVPVSLGFLVPFAFLAREAARRSLRDGIDPAIYQHGATTFALAAAATVATLAIGFAAVLAARFLRNPLAAVGVMTGGLGYATPGTVLALGLLTPFAFLDGAINMAARAVSGVDAGLVIAGTSAAIVLAWVARFLAISIGLAQSGLAGIHGELDDAARVSGAPPARVVTSVHLPLLRPAIGAAALLVCVDSLKELSATLLLRPLNVETLSTYVYQFATRGSFEDGALAALLIVLFGTLPASLMARLSDRAALVTKRRPPRGL